MSLKLGSTTTIVISSPHGAKEVVQKYDQIFFDNPRYWFVKKEAYQI